VAERRTVLIAGAGIGGLTAALALTARGFRVVLCERSAEPSELGAGIQLSPNAGHVLAELGLESEIARTAVEPAAIEVRSGGSERILTSLPCHLFRERYGQPWRVIHRGDLQALLLDAVRRDREISLRPGTTVQALMTRPAGHFARLERAGGTDVIPVAALVGADGIRSETRGRIAGAAPPQPLGRTAWRALVPIAGFPKSVPSDRVVLWLGRHAHLVAYPVSAGRAVNVVAIVEDAWDQPGWNASGEPDAIGELFAAWTTGAKAVIASAPAWWKYALAAVDPRGPWTAGPVALLGDAAHAMAPFLAQGGAMAIEDAAVLAGCLANDPDAESAFRKYEALRKPRVTRIAAKAERTGAVYHWGQPLALVRDMALRVFGPRLIVRQNDPIYRWRRP